MQMNNYLEQSPVLLFFDLLKGGNIWHIRMGEGLEARNPCGWKTEQEFSLYID